VILREIIATANRAAVEGFRSAVPRAGNSMRDERGAWADSTLWGTLEVCGIAACRGLLREIEAAEQDSADTPVFAEARPGSGCSVRRKMPVGPQFGALAWIPTTDPTQRRK
jgi:hypothetical protein